MTDPEYLRAMMHGEMTPKKKTPKEDKASRSKFENDLDKEIDTYVDSLQFEEDPEHKSLQSPKARREKMKFELKESLKLPELSEQISKAMDLLVSEGSKYLSAEANGTLISDLAEAQENLERGGLAETNETLQSLMKISDDSMKSIVDIGLAKFSEERYSDCVALFSFLSILNPGYSEYWFRLGIAAQKSDQIDLASRAYAATLLLDPNHIGARLFSAECFVLLRRFNEAKDEISAAKEIIKSVKVDKMWLDLIPVIENTLRGK